MTTLADNPFFSILIPAYNAERYLSRCINSLHIQEFQNYEIIIVDDCSTDKTYSISLDYQKRSSNISVYQNPVNSGTHTTRIKAASFAKGEYCLFIDPDDYFRIDALIVLFRNLSDKNLDILEFGYYILPDQTIVRPVISDPNTRIDDLLLPKNSYSHIVWNKAYSKKVIQQSVSSMESFYSTVGEDMYESIVFAYYAKNIASITAPLLYYSTQDGISFKKERNLQDIEKILQSFNKVINHTISFFEKHDDKYIYKCIGLEEHFFHSALMGYILSDTKEEDRIDSILLLPKYFSKEIVSKFIYLFIYEHHQLEKLLNKRMMKKIKLFIEKKKRGIIRRYNSFIRCFTRTPGDIL